MRLLLITTIAIEFLGKSRKRETEILLRIHCRVGSDKDVLYLPPSDAFTHPSAHFKQGLGIDVRRRESSLTGPRIR